MAVEVISRDRGRGVSRSYCANQGSHLRPTGTRVSESRDSANLLSATLNTDVWGPKGNSGSRPRNERQQSRKSLEVIPYLMTQLAPLTRLRSRDFRMPTVGRGTQAARPIAQQHSAWVAARTRAA